MPERYYRGSRAVLPLIQVVLPPYRHGTTVKRCSWVCCASDLHQSGTTAPCVVLPLRAGFVGYVSGRGSFHSPIPVQFAPSPRPLLSQATPQAPKVRRRAAGSRPSPSVPSGGILPHPLLLPWMLILPPFFSPLVLFLESRFWAIFVAFLDLFVESRLRKDLGDC